MEPSEKPVVQHEDKQYKAFAKPADGSRQYVLQADSTEEIIEKVREWNETRTEENKFITCSVGEYDAEKAKHINYETYNVASGELAEKLYLKLPSLKPEEFKNLTTELKAKGVRFDYENKAWYVTEDRRNEFQEYLQLEEKSITNNVHPRSESTKESEILDISDEKTIQNQKKETPVEPHEDKQYKAFAKPADGSRQYVLQGDSTEEIIEKIREWNETRTEDKKFVTCSIGEYDAEKSKHINYEAYSVESGKLAEKLYLKLPSLKPEEFKNLTTELKANGVRFDYEKKAWYITEDRKNEFQEYLQTEGQVVKGESNQQFANFEQNNYDYEALERELTENIIDRDVPDVPEENVMKKIDDGILQVKEMQRMVEQNSIVEQRAIKLISECKFSEAMDSTALEKESTEYIGERDIPDVPEEKAVVIHQAEKDGLSQEQIELLSKPEFSTAQANEIRYGFNDGLSMEQVINYARPELPSGQMDIYRYGQIHGIKPEALESIVQSDGNWADHRRTIDQAIGQNRQKIAQEFSSKGYRASPELVKKMENLNHLTKKDNSLKDVCDLYKNDQMDNPKCKELVQEIGDELKVQELAKVAQAVPIPE